MTPDFKDKELIGEFVLSNSSALRITKVTHNDNTVWCDVRTFVRGMLDDNFMPTKKGIHIPLHFVPELMRVLQQFLSKYAPISIPDDEGSKGI